MTTANRVRDGFRGLEFDNWERAREVDRFSPRQQLALLARMLHREGYDDHHNGHISIRQPDDTLLVNPWELSWEEVRASDVMQIDLDGQVLSGTLSVTPAIELHLAFHRRYPDRLVAVHHHPRYATVWAATGRIPPAYDQFSSHIRESRLGMLDEYVGGVNEAASAEANVRALDDADYVLLAYHGVFVAAPTVEKAHLWAASLEWRCRLAWHVEALVPGTPSMPVVQSTRLADVVEARGGFDYFFSSMARREIRLDPAVLDEP